MVSYFRRLPSIKVLKSILEVLVQEVLAKSVIYLIDSGMLFNPMATSLVTMYKLPIFYEDLNH